MVEIGERVLVILLIIFLVYLLIYICKMKKELRRLSEWIENDEYIYFIDIFDKDIENLALAINKKIKAEEKKEMILKKQDKNFKRMVANLSHDLRTPLTVIIGYLQLIKLEQSFDEPINHYMVHIEKKAAYLKKLVDDLYMFFWSEAIDDEIKMIEVNVTALASSILKEYIQNSKIASEQMEIILPHKEIFVLGQEKILTRILCNLIDNALKYSLGEIIFELYVEGTFCYITIINFSDYISEQELKSIFELFYTKDESRVNSGGIGLYSSKRLVQQLNGNIKAEYKEEKFRVTVMIPLSI